MPTGWPPRTSSAYFTRSVRATAAHPLSQEFSHLDIPRKVVYNYVHSVKQATGGTGICFLSYFSASLGSGLDAANFVSMLQTAALKDHGYAAVGLDSDQRLYAAFFMTAWMRQQFSRYPELLLVDATCKSNRCDVFVSAPSSFYSASTCLRSSFVL